jgi:DNA-binding transcriptional ArsR family regulator
MKNPKRVFKDRVYEQLARIGKAVASPQRLALLDLLNQGPRTVENLAQEAHLTVANTSRHLQVLRAARLIEAEKEGVFVRYRVADEAVVDFFRTLRIPAASRLAELDQIVRQFFNDRDTLEPVERKALLARARKGLNQPYM